MEAAPRPPRRYSGLTTVERRAQRRERLLEAGLELFGTQGYAGTSIRAVCAAAGLNPRYFYESFTSREDLLYHVYFGIVADIGVRVSEAVAAADTIESKARAGLQAGWLALIDDRRKARIIALEVVGVSDRLEQLRRQMRHALADLTAQQALSIAGPGVRLRMDPVLVSRALMGGVVEILGDWINGDLDASPDEVVEHFTRLFTAAAYASVESQEIQDV
ncbi:MAG TPA: TetR/AcrR family transcriptional regulator [Acidimicrobiales bacterium]|nr:TetR/AcrR family transcriptional regulator [Acidimicrobiales bacterium]